MTDLRKAAKYLLEGVEAAIKAGDWVVDGACDPDSAIVRLRQALAQPEQGNSSPNYPITESNTSLEWVGLTDEEILAVARDHYNPHQRSEISFAKAIEAKLKEKNT